MKRFIKDAICNAAKVMFVILFAVLTVLLAAFPVFIAITTGEGHWAWICLISVPMAIGLSIATIERIEQRW